MSDTAIVRTEGNPLNVRSSPNGEIIDSIPNGTEVVVIGSPVKVGNWNWVSIGPNRWVAMEFLVLRPTPNTAQPSTTDGLSGPKVVATQTSQSIAGGLKVYQTELIDSTGRVINRIRCISGRVGLQEPSNFPESQTPIPFGIYSFDYPGHVEYAEGEFGGVWSPVTPTFETQRGGFGIHYDPSAFENNSQSGTAGCLATPTPEERDVMTNFIIRYKPTHLIVRKG
ncbi:SH3 domain-containing protein [Limnoraphis robusta]|uniref:Peptide-binding protein n=1 Tax=Limnoraphis robusta CS-951 TaxID=1637645 RepID=A0A0F5YBG0_9CYAN|nr:SH3 domain-containing protein [Limnoraphis robusta]KKD36073.1 peptide-binding protein [Limnoraphis robusta CS-951]